MKNKWKKTKSKKKRSGLELGPLSRVLAIGLVLVAAWPGDGCLHIAVGVGAPVDFAVNIFSSLVIVREYFGVICIAPDGL